MVSRPVALVWASLGNKRENFVCFDFPCPPFFKVIHLEDEHFSSSSIKYTYPSVLGGMRKGSDKEGKHCKMNYRSGF